jgi:SAM-dependent methyltransferase
MQRWRLRVAASARAVARYRAQQASGEFMPDVRPREIATDRNFEADLYLAANPDVARHVAAGGDAWVHFDRHGRREGRHQLQPGAVGLQGSRLERKYRRFAGLFDPARGAGGRFRFLDEPDSFPIAYGGEAHRIDEYEAESANPGLGDFIDAVARHPDRLFLDVGCGRRSRTYDNCLYLDVYPSPSADLVMAPACRYPIADASLDGIGCFAVLEHVTEPWTAAAEFRRMLKPGGQVFIDYPFLVPVHGYPSHYYNATREGLRRLFDAGFEDVAITTRENQTPDHALLWQLNELLGALDDGPPRAELLGMSVADLAAQAPGSPFWRRVLDALPEAARVRLAAGNTLIARRS